MGLFKKSAHELSNMIKNKECSSVEILNQTFDRIEKIEDKVAAYLTIDKENALIKAKAVDDKIAKGEEVSVLAGIPIGIKDNILVKGLLNTCSSKMLENFKAPYNATVVNLINQNDMIITGKLNMDEFAMGSSTETSYFKKTKNPHNLECTPGGSSGGSVASVSSYECTLSLGSDTGGSIRQPASFCGVVGLKPTYSVVSRYGLVAFCSSFDQIGPIGRNVKDVAMLYSAICGYDEHDVTTSFREHTNVYNNLNPSVKDKVIGIPKEYFDGSISDEVKQSVTCAIKELEKHGAVVKDISLPSTSHAVATYYIISSAEASSNLSRFDGVKYGYRAHGYTSLEDMYIKTRTEGFGDEVKTRIILGTFVLSGSHFESYYKKAKFMQNKMKQEFIDVFKTCDLIITPTTPSTAFKIGEEKSAVKMYNNDNCTSTVNIAGVPAISIPCGRDKSGLPIGMQLIAPHFGEQTLFDVASFYEDNIYKIDPKICV